MLTKLRLCLVCVLIVAGVPASKADPAAGDNDLLEKVLVETHDSSNYMETQAAHTADFEKYLKCYLKGDVAGRQKAWLPILNIARKEDHMHALFKQVMTHLEFGEASEKPICSPDTVVATMVEDSEKFVGNHDWPMRGAYNYSVYVCEGLRKYGKAAIYKDRERLTAVAKYGADSHLARAISCELAKLLLEDSQVQAADRVLTTLEKQEKPGKDADITARIKTLRSVLAARLARKRQK